MIKKHKSRGRQDRNISARVLASLSNTPGMSDNEICRHIGVDIQKGTQSRYKLYRDGKVVPAGSRSRYGRIVKTWKIADNYDIESKTEIKPCAFKAPHITFEAFAETRDTASLGAKLEWLGKVCSRYPELVDKVVPVVNLDSLLSSAQEVESILSHPFNFLLGSNE